MAVTLVRAAGGVVTREGSGRAEVVLVHRPAYDDWSFPKGKLEPGEDDMTCALREVLEESGLECEPVRDLGSVTYVDARGRPKVVRYWQMRARDPSAVVARHEVDEARWVWIGEAMQMLTYQHDRSLLNRLSSADPDGTPVPVYLLRHLRAGERAAWPRGEPDELRPLSRTGLKDAERLVRTLGDAGITRLVSSPYLRCIQSLEPLSEAIDVPIDLAHELGEGQPISGAEAWAFASAADGPAVLSTHGDIVKGLVADLVERGIPVADGGPGPLEFRKGGIWRLSVHGGQVRRLAYMPPPEGPRGGSGRLSSRPGPA